MSNRTKQLDTVVETFNKYFKANHISNQYNEVALVLGAALQQANCYQGFNWYKTTTIDGQEFDVHCSEQEAVTYGGCIMFY